MEPFAHGVQWTNPLLAWQAQIKVEDGVASVSRIEECGSESSAAMEEVKKFFQWTNEVMKFQFFNRCDDIY